MAGPSAVTVTRSPGRLLALTARPLTKVGVLSITERGATGKAVECASWNAWQDEFGAYTSAAQDGPLAVQTLFEEAKGEGVGAASTVVVYQVRAVHSSTPADITTKTSVVARAVLVDRANTPVDTLRVDAISDGDWANSYSVKVAAASNGVSANFNLQVLKGTVIVETFVNLSMTDTDPNYVENVINEGVGSQAASKLIRVTDLDSATATPADLPATGTTLLNDDTSGANGLGSIGDSDYVGGNTSGKTAGLACFDAVPDLDVIIVPDRTTTTFMNSLVTYNNTRSRPAFLVLEAQAARTLPQIRTIVRTTAALIDLTERAAIYWPRTKVANPSTTVFGNSPTIVAPTCGQIAGLYARVAAAKDFGAFTSPAGIPLRLRTALALENDDVKDPTNRGLVFDDQINPITVDPKGGGIYVDGARTLSITGQRKFVGESRGVTFLEIQIGNALEPQRHKNNTPALRAAIKSELETFLRIGLGAGAYASQKEPEAFVVDASDALNPVAEQAAGSLHIDVGVATAKPAEFIKVNTRPL